MTSYTVMWYDQSTFKSEPIWVTSNSDMAKRLWIMSWEGLERNYAITLTLVTKIHKLIQGLIVRKWSADLSVMPVYHYWQSVSFV